MKRLPLRFASRADAVRQLRERLENGGWPRLQMMMLVMLTGASGFVGSFVMLLLGVEAMGLRYLLACCAAYLCFLCLLWIWINWRKGDGFDGGPDFSGLEVVDGGPDWHGGDGSSGGGGASAHFDPPRIPATPLGPTMPASAPPSSTTTTSSSGVALPDVDAEAIPILLAALVAGLVLSSLFVIWTAPALFAELMLDGVLAAGLYRRLRHIETRHWLQTALRKTFWPFVFTAIVLAAVGFGLQQAAPNADSIGDVLPYVERVMH